MIIKLNQFLLLLSLLFSFILSQNKIENVDFDGQYSDSQYSSKTYKLNFQKTYEYIHVRVEFTGKTPMVLMSNSDPQCNENRKLLGMQTYEPIHLFFRKQEIPASEEYLCIKCQKENDCDYDLFIYEEKTCKLSLGEQYSYYVNEKNSKMEFEFVEDKTEALRRLATVDSKLNFWVKGQDKINVETVFPTSNKKTEFDFGYTFYAEYAAGKSYILRISAEEGDYITVGSLKIDDNVSKTLRVNEMEIIGTLAKDQNEICFPIGENNAENLVYIQGNIFTKRAKIYIKHNNNIIDKTIKNVDNGLIEIPYNDFKENGKDSFCVSHLFENTNNIEIIFSLQFTCSNDDNLNKFIYSPLLPGVIYRYYILKGEMAVFRAMKPKEGSSEINFNMKAIKGFPDMLFDECKDYPNCIYHLEDLEVLENPHHSNRMTVYSYYLNSNERKEFTPITPNQPLLIVHCAEGTNDEDHSDDYCLFETSIFTNKERLNLVEGETFSQYLLKGETDLYSIDIKDQENLGKVYLDLIIFSGDVDFIVESQLEAHKYFISNKIFYSIHVQSSDTKIDFKVKAYKNSFYMVQYQLVRNNVISRNTNIIESGVNYIQSIIVGENADFYKEFTFKNFKFDSKTPYLASFYSQNCKFIVSRTINNDGREDIDTITLYDSYGQIIIDQNDPYFKFDEYKFRVDITEDDISDYKNKLCMLYITGLELSSSSTGSERYVSVSDGVPQYYIFSKEYPYMKYAFHVSDLDNPLILNFNLIDKAPYKVDVLSGYFPFIQKTIYRNEQIIIYPKELKNFCFEEDEVCTINVNIELENKDDDKKSKLETIIYQYYGAPIFLEKNAEKSDILIGNEEKHYYFDIGQGEMGDITIDYKRGYGYIFAKVVPKVNMEFDSQKDWRGMYDFPKDMNDTLRYETYLKKIIIKEENTNQCENGCYVLITVINTFFRKNPNLEEKIAYLPYRISITPRIYPSKYYEELARPRVKIKVNDYIIGNLYLTFDKIFEFYQVILPYDSDYVFIDWQADRSTLFVNVGESRPTLEFYDFKFEATGSDTMFKISKEQILTNTNYNSLKNIELTLGIWTEKLDSIYTSVYAFKVFIPPLFKGEYMEDSAEIYHIRTDQKVQCSPSQIFGYDYMCLFAVIFDEADVNGSLIVYPRAQKESVKVDFIGDLLESELIEKNNLTFILEQIENLNEEYSSSKGDKYIYVDKIEKNKTLFFYTYTNEETIIEVLSSTYIFFDNIIFTPNPSTPQLFALKDNTIRFDFSTTKDLLINIVSLSGEGFFYWETEEEEDQIYFLRGFEDRLTLTSGTQLEENKLSFLICRPFITEEDLKKGGFVFYITYYPRNEGFNIDQLKIGRSTEFVYRDIKFPLAYFAKLGDKNIGVSFTFYNFNFDMGEIIYDKPLFKLYGKIIKDDEAYYSRFDRKYWPIDGSEIEGSVDGHFATLLLTAKDIEKFKVNKEDNPNLFFYLDLNDESLYNKFNKINIDVSLLKIQDESNVEIYASKNIYYNGKLTNEKSISNPSFIYLLKVDHKKPFMRIEFSSNSNKVKWAVNIDKTKRENYKGFTSFDKIHINGRDILTLEIPKEYEESYIYLIVFNNRDNEVDPRLTNFVFKYYDGDDIENFFSFPIEEDSLQISKIENNGLKTYHISFSPIEHHDVIYYIKGVYSNGKVNGELMDTIAISESDSYNMQIENPQFEEIDKLTYTFKDLTQDLSYIKIMAMCTLSTIREYVLYEPFNFEDPIVNGEIIPSLDLIHIYYNSLTQSFNGNANDAYKKQKYKLIFNEKNEISNYLNLKISTKDNIILEDSDKDIDIFGVVSISTTDQSGKKDRIHLAKFDAKNEANIWIKKEQIESDFLFITVECPIDEYETCNYSIQITGSNTAYIDSIFNYYVSTNNKEMIFSFKNTNIEGNSNTALTVFANAGKSIKLTLIDGKGNNLQSEQIRYGAAITTKTSETSFEVKVEAEEGDFITIGKKFILDDKLNDYIKPSGNLIGGYLKRNTLEKECYLLDDNIYDYSDTYIIGIFYNQIAEISFKDSNFKEISNSKEIIKKGNYEYIYGEKEKKEKKYICVGMPDRYSYSLDYLAYSLQIIKSTENGIESLSPLKSGNLYHKIIKGDGIKFFVAGNSNSEEIIYNMLQTKGRSIMGIFKCTNYPLCQEDSDDERSIALSFDLNRMQSYHIKEKASPIDAEQYIMGVGCFGYPSDTCKVQVSINGDNDDVYLIEGQQFSQYLLKDKNSRYVIDFCADSSVNKVFIDIFVVSGDVDINLKNEYQNDIKYQKYYLSNKISFRVNKIDNSNIKNIFVNINSKVDSFYSIEYKLIRESSDENTYDIYDGINYLIPVSKEESEAKINIHNLKIPDKDIFISSFYSLNCKFNVKKISKNGYEEEIESFGNSFQDIQKEGNELDLYSYKVSIVEPDISQYNNNLCMLYVSGLEIPKNNDYEMRDILLSDGIPFITVFKEPLSTIFYSYPNPDTSKNIAIDFKVINPANYSFYIVYNSDKIQEKNFYQSNIEFIENTTISEKCNKDNKLCSIIFVLKIKDRIKNYVPIIEVTIRQIDNIPYYISKGALRQDFVSANSWLNLYTTVGKNEEGYVNVDFARGSGLIYAKILPINGKGDYYPDWRQYKFPREKEGTLKYDFYNKKLLFKKEDTNSCSDGCYLLISLRSSATGNFEQQFRFHQFSITVSTTSAQELKKNGPIIEIKPEEYVIGSLSNIEKINSKDMYEFYKLNIPYNAEIIEFDWQSDSATLLINVGDERPNLYSYLIKKESRSDTVFEISRDEIAKKFGKNDITNAILTIGIYTEKMESEFGTPYSFRVHFSNSKNENIYKISSDQKTLCKPILIDPNKNEYRCLFMITYTDLDFIYDVMIYTKSQNPSAEYYMVGNFIDKDIYDSLDMDKLKNLIPQRSTAAIQPYFENVDFIFLTISDYDSHLFVSVYTDKPDIIELITSFKTFELEMSPNPSSVQLFSINNNALMKLKFITTKPIFINFVSVHGSSKIYLNDDNYTIYNIRGKDDRLSLAIPNNGKETILIVENTNFNESDSNSPVDEEKEHTIEKPRVAFYLDYYLRSMDKNLDEISLESTDEIAYTESDFPLYYYSKLRNINNDINVFFNFHDLELMDNKLERRVIKSAELSFKGSVISQNNVYQLRTDKNAKPNNEKSVIGKYDPALQTGQIYLTSEDLKTNVDDPTLYLSFEKQQSSNIEYKSIRLELTATEKNSDSKVTEKLYQYGTILDKNDINSYKLKVNKTGVFRIQFASNSKNIEFSINNNKGIKTNETYNEMKAEQKRGKVFVTFKSPDRDFIYLNVFLSDKATNTDKRLNNYVFKYINSHSYSKLFEYPILNNNPKIELGMSKDKRDIEVTFQRIDKKNIDVVYSLKLAKKWELCEKEINETIALSESPSYVTQVHNPKSDTIILKMYNIEGDFTYAEVFAIIRDGPVNEYVAYEPSYFSIENEEIIPKPDDEHPDPDKPNDPEPKPDEGKKKDSSESDKKALIVICSIGGVVLLILVVLIIIVVVYNMKTKDLLENVNKISFSGDDQKGKNQSLLLENDNELTVN